LKQFIPAQFLRRQTFRRRLWLAILAVVLGFALHQPPAYRSAQTSEVRGMWMTNVGLYVLHHATVLDEVIHDAAAKRHINRLYPCVWSRGQTLYPSKVAPRVWSGGDILQSTLQSSQRQGVQVIPWFEYGLKLTEDSALARQHPEWLSRNQAGNALINPQPRSRAPWTGLGRSLTGADHVVMNPAHPEVQAFMVRLLTDVVSRYKVDGIQLDDHFALPVEFGYDPYTRQLFEQEMGYAPPSNFRDPEWMRWRADQLTRLMQKISVALRQQKPNLIISLSPNSPGFAYRESLQDWPTWVRQGYVDEVVLQAYRPSLPALQRVLADPLVLVLQRHVPIRAGLFAGPGFAAQPASTIAAQIRTARRQQYDGFVLFTWEFALGPLRRGSITPLQEVLRPLKN
jgi:uncharacterized lipoprotein YddW (UPF0748 family)